MSVRTKLTLASLPTMMLPYGIGKLLFVLILSAIMPMAIKIAGRTIAPPL
jgi:hypothetical protein